MENLIIVLIKRFGIRIMWVLMLVIMMAGGLVWGIAHFNAKAGEKVSVLWGMVEYIKGGSQPILEPSWPSSPDGKYKAVKVMTERGWQYQVTEIKTKRKILITQGEHDTPNDVKAGLFSPDSKRIAAAYQYTASGGTNRNYTWVGIWNIETGDRVDVQTIDGWTENIYSVFRRGGVPNGN